MKRLSAFILILFILSSSYVLSQQAVNGIEINEHELTKTQAELLYNSSKSFPNETELSIAVIQNEKVRFIGLKRKNDTIRLIKNHRNAFEIGSITKVFTASLLSRFTVDGKLSLGDRLEDLIEFKTHSKQKINLKQLANHTSGLPRLPSNLNLFTVDRNNPYQNYGEAQLKEYLEQEMKLSQEPGLTYAYSNLGAGILGYGLAKHFNTTYHHLLKEYIFQPYQMSNSTLSRKELKVDLVKGLNPNGEVAANWDFKALAGAGAIYATVEDLAKFGQAQFNIENKELQLTQKPTFRINKNMQIGLGWHILKRNNNLDLIWHNGGTGGYTSSMALDVSHKNGVIILSNVSAFNQNMKNIDELCFKLIESLELQ
jgi:CubicO group peptidase (beta-lactamase class C family)